VTKPVIIFDHVSKSYPLYHHVTGGIKGFLFNLPKAVHSIRNSRFEALRDISFQVEPGEAVGIIGRNGAGKSTTLGLMAGVLKPTDGKVTVRGRISPLLELGAGFHPELKGRENIVLNGVLLGLPRAIVRKKLDEIIHFSELGDFIDQPIRVYSSGMLARLGFSVVACLEPEILLIDEILSVGDLDFQKKSLEKMLSFKNGRTTIVFVSHGLRDVERLCDRVIWIQDRQIRMTGSPREVISHYRPREEA
jgi:lipopolysaccharide transport system ATP-binding protein